MLFTAAVTGRLWYGLVAVRLKCLCYHLSHHHHHHRRHRHRHHLFAFGLKTNIQLLQPLQLILNVCVCAEVSWIATAVKNRVQWIDATIKKATLWRWSSTQKLKSNVVNLSQSFHDNESARLSKIRQQHNIGLSPSTIVELPNNSNMGQRKILGFDRIWLEYDSTGTRRLCGVSFRKTAVKAVAAIHKAHVQRLISMLSYRALLSYLPSLCY